MSQNPDSYIPAKHIVFAHTFPAIAEGVGAYFLTDRALHSPNSLLNFGIFSAALYLGGLSLFNAANAVTEGGYNYLRYQRLRRVS